MTSKLDQVKQNIITAAQEAARSPDTVDLVAVSKTKPVDEIIPVLEQGHRRFGENKVQEAARKWPALREKYPNVKLHLIGPLQSNKVRQAIRLFDVIETLDRPKLARAIARISLEESRCCDCYIQVNIGQESQKAGIDLDQVDDFITHCRNELAISIVGLMCIPPAGENSEPYFTLLKEIANRNALAKLSMGMSGDYQTAIKMGATSVRVGTAIFGPRHSPVKI